MFFGRPLGTRKLPRQLAFCGRLMVKFIEKLVFSFKLWQHNQILLRKKKQTFSTKPHICSIHLQSIWVPLKLSLLGRNHCTEVLRWRNSKQFNLIYKQCFPFPIMIKLIIIISIQITYFWFNIPFQLCWNILDQLALYLLTLEFSLVLCNRNRTDQMGMDNTAL